MAVCARKEVGSFHAFHKRRSIYRVHEDHHEDEQAYIEEQLRITREKLGAMYHMRSRRGKERLIREIMDVNQKEIPGMNGWEYRTILADNFEAKTDMLVSFHDGETILIYLHWPKKSFTPEELMEEDRTKLALAKQFRNITMTGRLIYIFMCIERYLVSMYPDRDWTQVASRMWNRTKEPERWSEGTPGDLFREIVPERIMRFYKHGYGYEELNSMVFDKQLSLEDYTRLRGLYEGISKGDPKEEINQLVGLPEKLIYMVNLRDYEFGLSNQMTIEAILKAERILMKNGIELPDYASVEKFSYKRTSDEMPDKERSVFFGFGVDADELSILLNEANAPVRERLIEEQRKRLPNPSEKKEEGYMIRKITQKDIPDVVRVIRASFQTVADEFGFNEENAPGFTAFATTEKRVKTWMIDQNRLMYGYYKGDSLVGCYNLYLVNEGCELGSLAVLPEHRHGGIGKRLLEDAIIRAAALDLDKMILSIVEENTVLRKWYEKNGFIHTGTQKFDFFPFTCGYLERNLRESTMRIENLIIARGHIILWLEEEKPGPKYVYIPGELTTDGKFYADLYCEWNWIEKPEKAIYLKENTTVLGTVTDEEKVDMIAAANKRNKSDEKNVQIIFD